MIAIVTLLIIVTLSMLITRIATVALTMTGLSRDHARFQARSAYTGVGFTTSESEAVLRHPVRRRIIMTLMFLGNAGIVSGVASLLLSFVDTTSTREQLERLGIILGGLAVLLFIASSKWVDKHISRVIRYLLERTTHLEVCDYLSLLQLEGEYGVSRLTVREDEWLAGRTLAELDLPAEGILVLGIERKDGSYLGAARGSTRINPGDTLILYGKRSLLEELHRRRRGRAGDIAHKDAIEHHKLEVEKQEIEEREREHEREHENNGNNGNNEESPS